MKITISFLALLIFGNVTLLAADFPTWKHLSSKNGDLPSPNGGTQQTACVVADLDKDGRNDIVITERSQAPCAVWLRNTVKGWQRLVVDEAPGRPEAGGVAVDIDGDGDVDLVFGGDYQSNEIWWYENPFPNFAPTVSWKRRIIKKSGQTQHHDQIVGDFLGEGTPQLVSWNQRAGALLLFRIPTNPKKDEPWPFVRVASGIASGEGLAAGDIDGDGKLDIVGAGRWFKHLRETNFAAFVIDAAQTKGRAAVGNLKKGARPEAVMVIGDGIGRLKWYECRGDPKETAAWSGHDLLDADVIHGHSLQIADLNGDGDLDIFCAEMAKWTESKKEPDHPNAHAWVFYGDGKGGFTKTEVATGFGFHEASVADVNGDGRLDIVNKPYNWETPRLDIWLNQGAAKGR